MKTKVNITTFGIFQYLLITQNNHLISTELL